jgi:tetratricopeptide (TPR) repeat protein
MDKTADTSADMFEVVEWLQVNRQRVIAITSAVVLVFAIIGIYVWHKDYKESASNAALAELAMPRTGQEASSASLADSYLKVADDYPGTHGGERALLFAGGLQFDAGKFDAAHTTFDRFLNEYSSSPFANEALVGTAASLEAAGKTADAAARYEDLVNHHQADFITPQAKSALARCYVALNKPEKALALYEDLAKANNNDTWSAEARMRAQQLITKYPALAKPAPAPASSQTVPSIKLPTSGTPAATVPAAKK